MLQKAFGDSQMSLQRSPDSLAGFKDAALRQKRDGAGRDKGEGDVRGSRNHPPLPSIPGPPLLPLGHIQRNRDSG